VGQAIEGSKVVSLGESIHLTREMPLVRLGLVRFLHEQQGFNVLAFEGALIDAWTAQEGAYRSREPLTARARSFTRNALFGLWQTDQMEKVVVYALAAQSSDTPLYLTSFDIQPGMARAYGASAKQSVRAFFAALRAADPSMTEGQTDRWADALGPALNCRNDLRDEESLEQVERWIAEGASPALAPQRPSIHVEALRLVPNMMRRRIQHCRQVKAGGNYQELRDRHSAALARELLSKAGKLLLWAHHSHVHHNSLRRTVPSMGQHLKTALGDGLYTVGVFAAGGTAVDSLKAERDDMLGMMLGLASRPLPGDDRFGAERRLASLSEKDFFVDLRSASDDWAKPTETRLEVDKQMPTSLSRDFDGAILLHRVSGAELNFLPHHPGHRGIMHGEFGKVLHDRLIPAYPSLVDEKRKPGSGHRFGVRGDCEQRVGIDPSPPAERGDAIAARQGGLVWADHGDGDAGDLKFAHEAIDDRVVG
jgi:erythromycin esterase-like protein